MEVDPDSLPPPCEWYYDPEDFASTFVRKGYLAWVGFCSYLPLSQKMASHLISNLIDREQETEEARKLIEEALDVDPNHFEALDNL